MSLRTFAARVASLGLLLGACANPIAPTTDAPETPTLARGSSGGGTTSGGFYDGTTWSQETPLRLDLVDGSYFLSGVVVTLRQKGTALDGIAKRWVQAYDASGNLISSTVSDGSYKVFGNPTATGVSLVIDKIGESNARIGFVAALSPDGTRLDKTTPGTNLLGLTALVR
ncbi:MAG: hypothetical protein SFV24_02835 [Gemmatimonadales bacterium]|nr:hypothetical protein [Gemmatimonadota bacterium]MDX2056709.1 hypothetical protein [Gemmatimonadales bacterium]